MRKILPIFFVLSLFSYSLLAQCTTPGDVTIIGSTSGCTDRVAVYTVSSVGATSYEWVITGTNSKTQQSTTQYSIVFENSDVTIEVTPINGACRGNKKTVTILVSQPPNKPTIAQTGNTLDANVAAFSYQWYSGNTAISGANTRTFNPTTNGTYLVEAKNTQGCSVFSSNFNFFRTAIKEDAVFNDFTFYPNPVTTRVFTNFSKRYDLVFANLAGQAVLQETALQGKQQIDLTSLKRGLYLMKITSEGKTAVRKLLLK